MVLHFNTGSLVKTERKEVKIYYIKQQFRNIAGLTAGKSSVRVLPAINGKQHFNFCRARDRRCISTFKKKESGNHDNYKWVGILCGSIGIATVLTSGQKDEKAKESDSEEDKKQNRSGTETREFTREDVAAHKTKEGGFWVSYQGGVYDITDFIANHPGGLDKISLAAGASLEPFWALYAVHKREGVLEILEQYRIGNLTEQELAQVVEEKDPFSREPKRHPALKAVIDKPFNGEPPLELLTDTFLTPNDIFYVTNHLPVPMIDVEAYRLTVEGKGLNGTLKISLHELKTRFPKHSVTATLQCAGNRRSEMNKVRTVQDAHWGTGAISNATWGGVLLRDVLSHFGCTENSAEAIGVRYIHFEGLDVDFSGEGYSTSIPVEKALSPTGDVLLAYEMNGNDLPPDHGYPLRVIVPGFVGARNVKWLGRIGVDTEESNSHWHKNDYKGVCPSEDWDTVDFQSAAPILELPVTSAISKPYEGEAVSADEGEITVKGYAWSGGGRGIVRVDVSIDGGKTWQVAKLNQEETKPNRAWAWTLWEASVPLPEEGGKLEVCCKAVDTSYNVQPEHVAPIWNLRGFLNNAWHRIHVTVTPAEE